LFNEVFFFSILMNRYIFRNIKDISVLNEWEDFIHKSSILLFHVFINWSVNHKYLIQDAYKNAPNFKKPVNMDVNIQLQEVSNNFLELFEKELFTDVIFKIGKKELKGHKSILACELFLNLALALPLNIFISRSLQSFRCHVFPQFSGKSDKYRGNQRNCF
jgi:hypothetical protein